MEIAESRLPDKIALAAGEICHPPDGYDDCPLCENHFWSVKIQESGHNEYEGKLNDEEAAYSIRMLLEDVRGDTDYVKAKLETHGDLILTRWSKKSMAKRADILSTAAPGIFGEWPRKLRQRAYAEWAEAQPEKAATENDRYLPSLQQRYSICPWAEWLEIEDFMQGLMKLLSLLHLRTEYASADWALFDTRC